MKKCIKKILVLACVAVFAVSSMTAMAAETRAIACPNVCGGTLAENKSLVDKIIVPQDCKYKEGAIDLVDVYIYNVYYECTNCDFVDFRQVKEPTVYCSHK